MKESQRAYSICPKRIQLELEQKVFESELLKVISEELSVDHAFIAFIDEENIESEVNLFKYYNGLWYSKEKFSIEVLNIREGLTGKCLSENKIVISNDSNYSKFYKRVNDSVISEIVGPVQFNGRPTGVILLDRTTGQQFGTSEREVLGKYIHNLNILLAEIFKKDETIKNNLTNLAREFLNKTNSNRGYVAVKSWEGNFDYFFVGEDPTMFRNLKPWEGVCGTSFQEGRRLNVRNVYNYEEYIPSHPSIKSELILPIKVQGDTIGVINMESKRYDNYNLVEDEVLDEFENQASLLASKYIYPLQDIPDKMIISLFDSIMVYKYHKINSWIEGISYASRILAKKLKVIIDYISFEIWTIGEKSGKFFSEVNWQDIDEITVVECKSTPQMFMVYIPLLIKGQLKSILGIKTNSKVTRIQLKIAKRLSGLASEGIYLWEIEHKFHKHIELMELFQSKIHCELKLDKVVSILPILLGADHCTLFYEFRLPNKKILIPGPSSSREVYHLAKNSKPWYENKKNKGITSYVWTTGNSLNIKNVGDREELKGLSKDLVWRASINENREIPTRSLLVYPIYSANKSEVNRIIGVIRIGRMIGNSSKFSPSEESIVKSTSKYLSIPLTEFLNYSEE